MFNAYYYYYKMYIKISSSDACVLIVFFLCYPQMKVKILDRNDNRPMWPSTPIEYKISEEIPIGSLVATLRATDPDLDSTLTYTVIGDNGGSSSPLLLDAYTGNVRVRKPIDRETSPRHVLPVRVSDGVHHSDTSVVFVVSNIIYTICCNLSSAVRSKQLLMYYNDIY